MKNLTKTHELENKSRNFNRKVFYLFLVGVVVITGWFAHKCIQMTEQIETFKSNLHSIELKK